MGRQASGRSSAGLKRTRSKVHAVLAKCGVTVVMSDLFGLKGTALLDRVKLPAPYGARVESIRRLLADVDFEIEVFTKLARVRLAADPGYTAVQTIPGIGPALGAVLVAEIGDKRGRNIGVAAARHQLEYVYWALRDHHVRALAT